MQISGQNQNQIPQVQYNTSYSAGNVAPIQTPAALQPQPQYVQNPYPAQYPVTNPQYYYPQPQYIQQQPQNVQIPAGASGVNIQIFNPSVTTPGSTGPTYNVNSPNYPSNYYTGQYGTNPMQNPVTTNNPNAADNNPANTSNNGSNNINNSNNTNTTTRTDYTSEEGKKTKKRRVVMLTDDYIKTLENYLNSQDKSIRLNAAKDVFDRLDEDPSRKDDKALTALVNKMLQDPSQEIRLIALSALEGRIVNGDDITVQILKHMQTNPQGQGFDATDAAKILLQMAGQRVDKEVEEDPDKRTKIKTDKKEEEKSPIKRK